jgi:hypothetical protein
VSELWLWKIEINLRLCPQANYVREKLGGFYVLALAEDDIQSECGCGSMPYLRTLALSVRGPQDSCIYKPCF